MTGHNTGDRGATLDGVHGRIHAGQAFITCEFNTVSGNTTFYYVIETISSSAHLSFDISISGEKQIAFLKQITESVAGSTMTIHNLNDFHSNKTGNTLIRSGSTLSDEGEEWECFLIPGGNAAVTPGQIGKTRAEEYVLAPNNFYAIKIDNTDNTAADFSCRMSWYEPEV